MLGVLEGSNRYSYITNEGAQSTKALLTFAEAVVKAADRGVRRWVLSAASPVDLGIGDVLKGVLHPNVVGHNLEETNEMNLKHPR